jgi:hypothetical protein
MTDYLSSIEELHLLDRDVVEPIPLLGISAYSSSKSAQKAFRFSSGANMRPFGTYNDDSQERLTFLLKSDCTLDDMVIEIFGEKSSMTIPADDKDPLKLSESIPAEGEELELDQSICGQRMDGEAHTFRFEPLASGTPRPENDCCEPRRVMSLAVNDVLCGKGRKTVDHNLHYTRLCVQAADDYAATKKRGWSGKKGVALRVVRVVQLSGGRFLKPSSAGKGWDILSEGKSVEKTVHCIRDVIHRRRRTKRHPLGKSFM